MGDPSYPQTLHPYAYVGANPINRTDPSGRCYPPAEFIRSIEPTNCSNLDQALQISQHPSAGWKDRALANTYVVTWTGAHLMLLAGAGVLAWEAAGWAAVAGQSYLAAHPAAATVATVAAVGANLADDALATGAALSGDPQAAGQIMASQQLAATDGGLPFGDLMAAANLAKWHGHRLARSGLPQSLAECLTYNPFRTSGHTKRMQQAIVLALGPKDIIAFRRRPFGSTRYDFGPNALPSKPKGGKTDIEYPYGRRLLKTGEEVVSDVDAAWMLRDGQLVTENQFESDILPVINAIYGKDIVMHGQDVNGLLKRTSGAKEQAIVDIYGPFGYLESGDMVEMLVKYALQSPR
jgi:hypothetical protein